MIRCRWLWIAPLATLLGGCYVLQAVQGHLDIMSRERPIGQVLSDAGTPQALRARLESVLRVRDFASRELALPDNGSYRSYADLGRPYVVWNVFAAPQFSVEPKLSCFLVVGCVPYRGYYRENDAILQAAQLGQEGYDTYVAGVPAYSTLGWFDDPVLSSYVGFPESEIARIIFHELAHQVAYVKSDSTFNESFAVAVEREGVRRWLASAGSPAQRDAWQLAQSRRQEFIELMLNWRARMASYYEVSMREPGRGEAKRRLFEDLRSEYGALKARWGGFGGYDRLIGKDLNNALLVSISTYTALEPAFTTLIEKHHGDMSAFYAEVKSLAGLDSEARLARLRLATAALSVQRIEGPRHP